MTKFWSLLLRLATSCLLVTRVRILLATSLFGCQCMYAYEALFISVVKQSAANIAISQKAVVQMRHSAADAMENFNVCSLTSFLVITQASYVLVSTHDNSQAISELKCKQRHVFLLRIHYTTVKKKHWTGTIWLFFLAQKVLR